MLNRDSEGDACTACSTETGSVSIAKGLNPEEDIMVRILKTGDHDLCAPSAQDCAFSRAEDAAKKLQRRRQGDLSAAPGVPLTRRSAAEDGQTARKGLPPRLFGEVCCAQLLLVAQSRIGLGRQEDLHRVLVPITGGHHQGRGAVG